MTFLRSVIFGARPVVLGGGSRGRSILTACAAVVSSVLGCGAVAAASVDYEIPNAKAAVAVHRPGSWPGWAAAAATMHAWKTRTDADKAQLILQRIFEAGFMSLLSKNKAMPTAEKDAFLQAMGLEAAALQTYTIAGWDSLLRRHGALWVTVADGPKGQSFFSNYARIVKRIAGDGTLTGTIFTVIDPMTGEERDEPIVMFLRKFEQAARAQFGEQAELRPQVVHYRADR